MMYIKQSGAIRASSFRWPAMLLGAILLLSLAGCGGGGGGGNNNTTDTGTAVMGLTDAPGDFLTYTVDVVSIRLVHADGRVVETLPLKTRVDFAQYADMTEFLTAASVPLGSYKQAFITLDYSTAQIEVEGNDGQAVSVPVAQIHDSQDQPVTTLQMQVQLDRNVPVALGLPRYIMFDFNLAQSNTVSFNTDGSASIKVDPVLIATVDKESPKLHRLRGPLKSVSVEDGTYDVYIRPYFRRMLKDRETYGQFHVYTGSTTVFDINGEMYRGSDGLRVLDGLPQYTAVVAVGHLRLNPLHFDAVEVRAGSSVAGGTRDAVKGSVIARNGNTVTLRGATLIRSDGAVVFNDDINLSLDSSATVTRELDTATHSIDDIAVGQRLTAFGSVSQTGAGQLDFSTVNGYIRMELSQVRGQVTTLPAMSGDPLILNLTAINGRDPAIYQLPSGHMASSYQLETGSLDLSTFANGDDMAARGFPKPYTYTGSLDFSASTLIQYPNPGP